MRMMKKIMTGMSVAAFAMVVAAGMNVADASADATLSFGEEQVSTQTAKVTGEAAEVMVSFDAIKVNAKTKAVSWNPKAKWDVYDGTSATIDLSALKTTKDNYIAVKDNKQAKPNVYKIPAETATLSGKYAVTDGKSALSFSSRVGKTKSDYVVPADTDADTAVLEYRTENSSKWTAYVPKTFKLATYEQQGATLYFRKKAVKTAFTEPDADAKDAPAEYALYTYKSGNFAGKEFKIKVAKMPAAPTATIDYNKGTFTIKKGSEYRWLNKSGEFVAPKGEDAEAGDFTPAAADAAKTVVSIADITKDGAFEVRTAAAKKVASKIAVYAYKGVATPVKTTDTSVDDGKLTLTYGTKTVRGKAVNQITFKNTDPNVSYIVYNGALDGETAPKVVATLKKYNTDTRKYKDVSVLATAGTLKDVTKLYIVTASDKKTGTFRSQAVEVPVAYPAAPAPSTSPAPAPSVAP